MLWKQHLVRATTQCRKFLDTLLKCVASGSTRFANGLGDCCYFLIDSAEELWTFERPVHLFNHPDVAGIHVAPSDKH